MADRYKYDLETQTDMELTWKWFNQVAQSQMITKIMMQTNLAGGDMP